MSFFWFTCHLQINGLEFPTSYLKVGWEILVGDRESLRLPVFFFWGGGVENK